MQMRHRAWDPQLVGVAVTINPPAVLAPKRIALWSSLGHIPFDRPAEELPARSFELGDAGEPAQGAFSQIDETVNADIVRVGGWLAKNPATTSALDSGELEIVFVDGDGRQRSLVHIWPHPRRPERFQWAGLVLSNTSGSDRWHTWTPLLVRRNAAGDERLSPLPPLGHLPARWRQLQEQRAASRQTGPSPAAPATPESPPPAATTADPNAGAAPPG